MVKITIDNKVIEAQERQTILEAASQANIYIPTVCYNENLSSAGSCRVCVVEITVNGKSELVTSCNYPVSEGLKVKTDSTLVKETRNIAVQLLMAQQPHSDRIEEIAKRFNIPKPSFTLEEKECILCGLCVRACRELVGPEAVTFIDKGKDRGVSEATVVHSKEKCIGCDSCAFICPTEAIVVEDVKGKRTLSTPSGKLEFKLKKCKKCGRYWAPEKQLEYIIKRGNLEPDIFDTCPDCRD